MLSSSSPTKSKVFVRTKIDVIDRSINPFPSLISSHQRRQSPKSSRRNETENWRELRRTCVSAEGSRATGGRRPLRGVSMATAVTSLLQR